MNQYQLQCGFFYWLNNSYNMLWYGGSLWYASKTYHPKIFIEWNRLSFIVVTYHQYHLIHDEKNYDTVLYRLLVWDLLDWEDIEFLPPLFHWIILYMYICLITGKYENFYIWYKTTCHVKAGFIILFHLQRYK